MKKRVSALLICLAFVLCLAPQAFAAGEDSVFSGAGTQESPYLISTARQLIALSELVNGADARYSAAHYQLTADISLAGVDWTPIGVDEAHAFQGTFDGAFYFIKNLAVHQEAGFGGLFGYVDGGTVKNLLVDGAVYAFNAAGIVGQNTNGTVLNCSYSGDACSTTADPIRGGSAGGIVCSNIGGIIANCFYNGGVVGPGACVVCDSSGGAVENCYYTTGVPGSAVNGYYGDVIENCYAQQPFPYAPGASPFGPNFRSCAVFFDETGKLQALDGSDEDVFPDPAAGGAETLLDALNAWVDAHPGEGYAGWTQLQGAFPTFGERGITVTSETGDYLPLGQQDGFELLDGETGGEIYPARYIPLIGGNARTVQIIPKPGYRIFDVLIDGQSAGGISEYTFKDTSVSHTMTVKFVRQGTLAHFVMENQYAGYDDVDESLWYGTAQEGCIRDAARLGFMTGSGDGKFLPSDGVHLSELMKIASVINSTYCGNESVFDQTEGANWWSAYVKYAEQNGIVGGGGFSDYTRLATRGEMAYLLFHALPEFEYPRQSPLAPPDLKEAEPYAYEISRLYEAGVLKGSDESGTFHSDWTITRAELSAIIVRVALRDRRVSV